ncbi:MAG: hypothetical protein WD063_05320 [Pirellulales bacterium]
MPNPESANLTMRQARDLDKLVLRRFLICLLVWGLLHVQRDFGSINFLSAAQPAKALAVIRGRTIELQPAGGSFQIPQHWLDWQAKYHENIHLSPTELARVRVADGEWDKEYAEIVNALLPFGACLAHLGGDGWGPNSSSYHDVQMRVYLVELTPQQIAKRMTENGPRLASGFSKKVSLSRSEFDNWQRLTLRYDLWYSDYGGTANVDVFARAFGKQTAVLVFMYADSLRDPRRQVAEIVHSFTWKQ